MKTPYHSITLRYVHDVVTGEFANVGVVIYVPDQHLLDGRFTTSYERLNAMFLKVDHLHFRTVMRHLESRLDEIAQDLRESLKFAPLESLPQLVQQALPQDDSSLQWGAVAGGFTDDAGETLKRLYERHIERYSRRPEIARVTEEDIAKSFREKLEKRKVAKRVVAKSIETNDYQYQFQFAWKNDVWHLYEPVSFDLQDANSIREKANRWLGRAMALRDSTENFKLHFLLAEPRSAETRKAFENATHILQKIPGEKELVRENEEAAFVEKVAAEIESHSPANLS